LFIAYRDCRCACAFSCAASAFRNLGTTSAENLHQLFFKLRDEFGQTFVIVTHDEELANMADRKLVMVDGLISN
jgi:ABC-type lipoprotein export system ATPase subunit